MWKIVETKNYTKVTQANNTVFISSQINALSICIMYLISQSRHTDSLLRHTALSDILLRHKALFRQSVLMFNV